MFFFSIFMLFCHIFYFYNDINPRIHHYNFSLNSQFSAALFAISKTWNQPKCPLSDEWIKKM